MSADRKKIDDGGSAFPVAVQPDFQFAHDGMSLRDWYAGQFLAGASTSNEALPIRGDPSPEQVDEALRAHWSDVAHAAFIAADAFIAARKAGA
ncbi:MAG: hypothetical protein DI604_35360 [Delftia acidovorans]|nr:MAG: hypothetical protein DI604_35360 [Delftia acidovorans]